MGPGAFGVPASAGPVSVPPDPGFAEARGGTPSAAAGGCSRNAPAFSCAWRRASTSWRSWASLPQAWARQARHKITGAGSDFALLLGLCSGKMLSHRPFFFLPSSDLLGCGRFPNSSRLIRTTGDDPPPVRRKGNRSNPRGVSLEREQFPPAGRLPHLGRIIQTAGDNPLAVRRKGRRANPFAVPLERNQFPTTGRPHTFAVLSSLPVTILWPSGEKATE